MNVLTISNSNNQIILLLLLILILLIIIMVIIFFIDKSSLANNNEDTKKDEDNILPSIKNEFKEKIKVKDKELINEKELVKEIKKEEELVKEQKNINKEKTEQEENNKESVNDPDIEEEKVSEKEEDTSSIEETITEELTKSNKEEVIKFKNLTISYSKLIQESSALILISKFPDIVTIERNTINNIREYKITPIIYNNIINIIINPNQHITKPIIQNQQKKQITPKILKKDNLQIKEVIKQQRSKPSESESITTQSPRNHIKGNAKKANLISYLNDLNTNVYIANLENEEKETKHMIVKRLDSKKDKNLLDKYNPEYKKDIDQDENTETVFYMNIFNKEIVSVEYIKNEERKYKYNQLLSLSKDLDPSEILISGKIPTEEELKQLEELINKKIKEKKLVKEHINTNK